MLRIDYNSYRTVAAFNKRVRFLVIHYTAGNFRASIDFLVKQGQVSAHYLIPDPTDPTYKAAGFKEQKIFNLVSEEERAWHAGVSQWRGRTNLNDSSIGIEIVNEAKEEQGVFIFPSYKDSQIKAIRSLARNVMQRYPDIDPRNIIGHSDIAYERKSDPGPEFSWYDLYEAGLGAWYDNGQKLHYEAQFSSQLPDKNKIIEAFRKYGYALPLTEKAYTSLVRAFQMHFRPTNYDGKMDIETCSILYALNDKYS